MRKAIPFLFLGLVIFSSLRGIRGSLKSLRRVWDLGREVGELEEKKRELGAKIEERKSLSFVERVARDMLMMVKPGEEVLILEGEEGRGEEERILGEEEPPCWKQWFLVFGFKPPGALSAP